MTMTNSRTKFRVHGMDQTKHGRGSEVGVIKTVFSETRQKKLI